MVRQGFVVAFSNTIARSVLATVCVVLSVTTDSLAVKGVTLAVALVILATGLAAAFRLSR